MNTIHFSHFKLLIVSEQAFNELNFVSVCVCTAVLQKRKCVREILDDNSTSLLVNECILFLVRQVVVINEILLEKWMNEIEIVVIPDFGAKQ